MMRQKQIIIEIDHDGNCSVDGEGFIGPECSFFIKEIEESLGDQTSQRDKEEYYQRERAKGCNRQRETR